MLCLLISFLFCVSDWTQRKSIKHRLLLNILNIHKETSTIDNNSSRLNKITQKSINSTIYLNENEHYYIHSVIFNEMNNKSIFYSSKSESQSTIRIESCIFSLATYEFFDHGGNIYIKNCLECIQDKICCFNCSLINTGKHSYVRVVNNADSKNSIFQSSISQLSGHGSGAFVHRKGDIQVKDINITNCKNSVGSAFQIREISKNSTTLQSNINNNTATNNIGLAFLDSKDFYFKISNCNIIKQTVHDKYDLSGVIILKGRAIFDSCVITDNVHPKGYLFKTYNDDQVENVIIISNSFMNNSCAKSNNGVEPIIQNEIHNIDDIKIEFLTSQICHEINFTFFQFIRKREGYISKFAALQSLTLF